MSTYNINQDSSGVFCVKVNKTWNGLVCICILSAFESIITCEQAATSCGNIEFQYVYQQILISVK